MRIAAVAFMRGLVFRRLDVQRSPLFAHCQRRCRSQARDAEAPAQPPDPKDAEEAAQR